MQLLILFMIVAVTTFELLSDGDSWGRLDILPGWAAFFPEITGALAIVYVVLEGTRDRFRHVRPEYWMVFGALVISILCGIVVNQVAAGPIVAGVRSYLRAIPFFLLPAAYAFSDRQLRTQVSLVGVIALVQVPMAVEQRMLSDGSGTGDFITGTLVISSVLSIFLICCISVAAALLTRKYLKPWQFLVLFFLLVIPTMINETKGTLVLLPIGLYLAFMAGSRTSGQKAKYAVAAVAFLAAFVAMFVPMYDDLVADREYGTPIGEFLSDPMHIRRYLYHEQQVGTTQQGVGRVDAIVVPLQNLVQSPTRLVFGYGIGNASHSALGPGFVGQYNAVFRPFLTSAFGRLALELGLLGMGLILALMWLVYRDAKIVAKRDDGWMGAFSAGWVAVTVVITISLFYKEITAHASLSFLFWYFAGVVAAARMKQPAMAPAAATMPVVRPIRPEAT